MPIAPLDKKSVHRICVGQVVVDLAGAVKELVENALDAGALTIDVVLRDHGLTAVEVADNGCGVAVADRDSLCLAHHTSKLRAFDDLETIRTLGFRGEALAALAAVGRVEITTCTDSDVAGCRLVFGIDGRLVSSVPEARSHGTTVAVRDIFYNLPVRLQELTRNARRGYAQCVDIVQAYALFNPHVKFTLLTAMGSKPPQRTFQTFGSGNQLDVIGAVLGTTHRTSLLPFDFTVNIDGSTVTAKGLISGISSSQSRGSADRQYVAVNGRPCVQKKLVHAINDIYGTHIIHRYPVLILNLSLDPQTVDVNVSPDKKTIFLLREQEVIASLREQFELFFNALEFRFNVDRQYVQDTIQTSSSSQSLSSPARSSDDKYRLRSSILESSQPTALALVNEQLSTDPLTPDTVHSPAEVVQKEPIVNSNDDNRDDEVDVVAKKKRCREPKLNTSSLLNSFRSSYESYSACTVTEMPGDVSLSSRSDGNPWSNTVVLNESTPGDASHRDDSDDEHVAVEDEQSHSQVDSCCGSPSHASSVSDGPESNDNEECHVESNNLETSVISEVHAGQCSDSIAKEKMQQLRKVSTANCQYEADIDFLSEPGAIHISKTEGARYIPKVSRIDITDDSAAAMLSKLIKKEDFQRMQVLGQFNKGFIIVRLDHDLYIIDQHASDEKSTYERLQSNKVFKLQQLIAPVKIQLSPMQSLKLAADSEGLLDKFGYDAKIVDSTLIVSSIPTILGKTFSVDEIESIVLTGDFPALNRLLASKACRTSVMIGMTLDKPKMEKIVHHMSDMNAPWRCPHGRPTMRHLLELCEIKTDGNCKIHDMLNKLSHLR